MQLARAADTKLSMHVQVTISAGSQEVQSDRCLIVLTVLLALWKSSQLCQNGDLIFCHAFCAAVLALSMGTALLHP